MSSKRKWDQAGSEEDVGSNKAVKGDDNKTASEAAAAAAAIAAKIAAQFAGGSGTGLGSLGPRDPHDGDFTHDIDINDVRNRYLLTKGSTQDQVSRNTILSRSSFICLLLFRYTTRLGLPSARRGSGIPIA